MTCNLRITANKSPGKLWHYAHFCFDFLFPMISYCYLHQPGWKAINLDCRQQRMRLGTFRPMAELLIGLPITEILTDEHWRDLTAVQPELVIDCWGASNYPKQGTDYLLPYVQRRHVIPASPYEVIMIERQAETLLDGHQDTGRFRRYILGHEELVSKLQDRFGERFKNVVLEGMPVLDQIGLFRDARVMLGQHGAGLSNCMWNKYRGGRSFIGEFTPRNTPHFLNVAPAIESEYELFGRWFDRIARRCEEAYNRVTSKDNG